MKILINSIEITPQYQSNRLFRITYKINSDPICYVNLINIDDILPQIEGQEIIIYDNDDVAIFGGDIAGYTHSVVGSDTEYYLICRGWENVINRKCVRKIYQSTTLPTIMADIFSSFVYEHAEYTMSVDNTGTVQRVIFETKVLDTIRLLEKITGTKFWITPGKTVNMKKTFTDSGITISAGNQDVDNLKVDIDSSQLVSKILFRGADILSTEKIADYYSGDGQTTQWTLTFPYSELKCYINSVEKIVGILNIHEEKDYSFMADFDNKVARVSWGQMLGTAQGGANSSITLAADANAHDDYYNGFTCTLDDGQARVISDYDGTSKIATITGTWPTSNPTSSTTYSMIPVSTDIMKFEYYYYYPLVFDKQYNSIITSLIALLGGDGVFEAIITKEETKNVKSREEAYSYCDAYVADKGNVDIGVSFTTYEKTYNAFGQYITINRPDRGLTSQKFLCTGVTIQSESGSNIKYTITLQSKLVNIETLLKDLLRKNSDSPVLLLNSSESNTENIRIYDYLDYANPGPDDYLDFDEGYFNKNVFG